MTYPRGDGRELLLTDTATPGFAESVKENSMDCKPNCFCPRDESEMVRRIAELDAENAALTASRNEWTKAAVEMEHEKLAAEIQCDDLRAQLALMTKERDVVCDQLMSTADERDALKAQLAAAQLRWQTGPVPRDGIYIVNMGRWLVQQYYADEIPIYEWAGPIVILPNGEGK